MFMGLIIGFALVIMILAGIYSFHLLRRMFTFWYRGEFKRWHKIVLVVCSCIMAAGCLNPFGTPALVLYHLFAFAVLLEIINGVVHIVAKANKADKREGKHNIWKKIYCSGIVPIIFTAIVLIYGHAHMLDVNEKVYNVTSDKAFSTTGGKEAGYKVSFISDLHFGTTMNETKLTEYCSQISKTEPDIVVLGGDIVDERSSKEEMQQAFKCLGNIDNKYGIFYVYGNHDRAGYSNSPNFSVDELNNSMEENGIICLSDETYEVNDDLLIVGRNDKGYSGAPQRPDTAELLKGQDMNRYILLVDHQPVELKENAEAGVDLQLSGHTHGGQIWPVGLISDILGFGEINYGEKQIDDYRIIVSSGIAGWGYAVRTGHESEYLTINIKN